MKLIAAVDRNWAIGHKGALLARIPADLGRFQALTMGHAVILGRKTLATFPGGRPLKGRENLILSATPGFSAGEARVFSSLEALLAAAPDDAFVIGGESVYRALLGHCDTALITMLDAEYPADAHLPDLDADPAWVAVAEEGPFAHEGLGFSYVTYRRRDRHVP